MTSVEGVFSSIIINMKKITLFFGLLLVVSIQTLFGQQTQELKSFDDTYVYRSTSGTGDEIRGLEQFVYTYHSLAGSQFRREVFLRFDISGLSVFVENIKLRMYVDLKEAHTFDLYPVAKTAWVEDGLNANNKLEKLGADATTYIASALTADQGISAKYYEWDVTVKRMREVAKYGTVKGIIWHQGSADSGTGAPDYTTYKTNMKTMAENFRKELNLPNLPFICGELSDDVVRPEFKNFNVNVIQAVKSYIPNSDFVYANGVVLLSDGIHFDAPSVIMLGERYADKFLEVVYGITSTNEKLENKKNIQLSLKENVLNIDAAIEPVSVNIFDIQGRKLNHFSLQTGENKTETFLRGVYMVSVNSKSKQSVYKVLIAN
jgi:hypothetical protein